MKKTVRQKKKGVINESLVDISALITKYEKNK